MTINKLYRMELHEVYKPETGFLIMRVAGGWLYDWMDVQTFVPYNTEFAGVHGDE